MTESIQLKGDTVYWNSEGQKATSIQILYPLYFAMTKTLRHRVITNWNPPHMINKRLSMKTKCPKMM
jgi:hypothetical protein